MWLHVGIVRVEQLFDTIERQRLGHVDIFATAVIAFGRITLGVLVGKHRTLGLHDAWAGVILGSNQFDMVFLPLFLVLHGAP